MERIVIFYNPLKPIAQEAARQLEIALKLKNFLVNTAETVRTNQDLRLLDGSVKLVIALGGDGTFLLAGKQAMNYDVPILGINFGHLGFLSEYGNMGIDDLAQEVFNFNLVIEERTIIEAQVLEQNIKIFAINDIVVNRSTGANLLYTDLYIDGDLLHTYRSDGVVICTPTGSTAYALSAGGAIMDPNIRGFQIVPIAAHSLNSRPQVVSDLQTIVLASSAEKNTPFTMQSDGQELITINPGSRIIVSKAKHSLKLAKFQSRYRSFYSILRDKMKWGSIAN